MDVDIRPALDIDLPGITALYNHYVLTSPATFDIGERTLDDRRAWAGTYGTSGPHRLLVGAVGDDVLAYATSGPFRPKEAYATSVETSVYVRADATGRGLGRALYAALFEALAGQDVHRAYAGITRPNPASVALHLGFGFRSVGVFTEQGRKFGRWWDVEWFEKPL